MSFGELHRYIGALRASGYTVGRLSITLWKKLAYPLITVVMALLAFPFALTVGRRGTLVVVSVGIVVAIAYWSTASLLEALGNLNQLPAPVAAWSPDALFLGLGLYFLLRVPPCAFTSAGVQEPRESRSRCAECGGRAKPARNRLPRRHRILRARSPLRGRPAGLRLPELP